MSMRNNTEIKALIADYLKRTDLTTDIVDFIRLAEKRIIRSLSSNGMLDKLVLSKSITTDTDPKNLPAGIRGLPVAVYLETDPKQVLDYMPADEFFRRHASSTTGRPKAYTVRGKQIYLGPVADSSYTLMVWFRQEPNITRTLDQLLVEEQTETDFDNSPTTEGSFSGGTGHAAGDVITLSDGTQVTVEAVSGGVVTEFTLTTSYTVISKGNTLTQSSSTGTGVNFSITVEEDNLSNPILQDNPELYLYGALIEGFGNLRNQTESQKYMGLFQEAIDSIENENFMSGSGLQIHLSDAP